MLDERDLVSRMQTWRSAGIRRILWRLRAKTDFLCRAPQLARRSGDRGCGADDDDQCNAQSGFVSGRGCAVHLALQDLPQSDRRCAAQCRASAQCCKVSKFSPPNGRSPPSSSSPTFRDPLDECETDSARGAVRRVINSLPGHYARILELRFGDELSGREIARTLQMSEDAAESLLARARQAFKSAWTAMRHRAALRRERCVVSATRRPRCCARVCM